MDQLVQLIVDESKWLTASLGVAFLTIAVVLIGSRSRDLPLRQKVMTAMNLFFAMTIGTMAFGHLLAVTVKLGMGTLQGPVLLFYLIGIVLAAPSGWLALHAFSSLKTPPPPRKNVVLNAWLAVTLLAMGLHNLPLAAPGLLNIAYHAHTRTVTGWAIVGLTVLVGAGLLVGSIVFLLSGQSFEQFSGMD